MTLWCRLGLKPSILGSSPSIAQTFCCVHPFHLKCALNENVTIFDNELASHTKLDRIRPGGACTILRICNNKMQAAVFGESLDELANRQRARIWLPLVGSHSGGIVS